MAKILVVEDNFHTSEMISLALQRKNHVVASIADGLKALDEVRSFSPEIIILDLMLPGLSGVAIVLKLLETEEYKKIPVIVVTAKGEIEEGLLYSKNIADIIFKPFQIEQLTDKIESILEKKNKT